MLNLYRILKSQVGNAIEEAFPDIKNNLIKSGLKRDIQVVAATKPEFGDLQINEALSLSKILKKSPREIAKALVSKLNNNQTFIDIFDPPQIAGPGFINLTIKKSFLIKEIQNRLNDKRLGIPLEIESQGNHEQSTIVIDFSSPNIAKEMHVGHLRSTIIGDCLSRIFEFRGYKVLRINHVGDWGTQFGMLINHLKEVAPEALDQANSVNIEDLVRFYREAKQKFDNDIAFQSAARQQVVKLQSGDSNSVKAWKLLCDQSRKEFQKIYDILDIKIKERGESFYNSYLPEIVNELERLGLLVEDDGAKCVFLDNIIGKNGQQQAVIIQKRDGGFNYATTDLAAIKYRFNLPPDGDGAIRVIYVTDSGQANHFKGVFEIAKRAKWIPKNGLIEHVPFGLVHGDDGKKLKTRSGDTIRLIDLIEESIEKAEKDLKERLLEEKRDEDKEFILKVSSSVGIAAIKYADLSQNRVTNYQFSFEKMLSLNGNTAPYLLYALVRISGIARKGGVLKTSEECIDFKSHQEWNLIKAILKFDEIIIEVEKELLPNRLCNYLFELSQIFNRFYEQLPILKADSSTRNNRLILCKLTEDTLKLGMSLLGLPTLERM